ncbi:hypothetical protein [Enterococcus phage PEF7b]
MWSLVLLCGESYRTPSHMPPRKAHHTSIPQSLLISFNKNKSTTKLSIRLLRFALR